MSESTPQENTRRPKVRMVGEDGNALSILGRASRAMRKEGWTKHQIDRFVDEATSGDYNNVIGTVMKYCDVD